MIVLVTGSREYQNRTELTGILQQIFRYHKQIAIVVGDCPTGADDFARHWCEGMWAAGYSRDTEIFMRVFAADWNRKCDEKCYHPPRFQNIDGVLVPYCPVAGHLRNQEMVDFMGRFKSGPIPLSCLAFYRYGAANKGTADCVRRARLAGIKIQKVWQHT